MTHCTLHCLIRRLYRRMWFSRWNGHPNRKYFRRKLNAPLSQFVHFEAQIDQIPAFTTWMSRVNSHISKTLGEFESSRHMLPRHQTFPVRRNPGVQWTLRPSLWPFSSPMLSSAGVAPMPLSAHKLLSVTVTFSVATTIACCPSPSSMCDLHICCWQGGDICQTIAAEACTLFGYAL